MHELVVCPYCGHGDRQMKAGTSGSNQRFLCSYCAKRYVAAAQKRGYSEEIREKVRVMRAAGAGIEEIARTCGVSKRTVFLWLSEARQSELPPAERFEDKPAETAPAQPVPKRASIKDVAARAGVSVSTVSNFLNRAGRMNEDTEKRIRAAIEDLHYAPNSLTRAIRERRTRTLGLITYGISTLDGPDTITAQMIAGMNDSCRQADYDFLIYTNFWQPEKHYTGVSFLNGRVDGLVWVAPEIQEPLLEHVGAAGLPAVALLTRHVPPGVGYVNANNVGGIERAVEHVVQLGHRRLAYLGPVYSSNYMDRRDGFWNAVKGHGLSDGCCEFSPRSDFWSGKRYERTLERWCTSPNRPTAILTCDDGLALIVIEWLEAHGYRVPDDFSIIGFNDAANAATEWPGGLTTLKQPFREIARTAAHYLIDWIEGRAHGPICAGAFDVELIVRGSTGLAPEAQ